MKKEEKMKTIELTFTEPLLATTAGDKELATEFILSKRPNGAGEDEADALETAKEAIEKSSTIFMRDDKGRPFLWDYQVKGFFKDACGMLNRAAPAAKKVKAYKKVIDGLIFVAPRRLPIVMNGGGITIIERPLRASTAQGERIALARSEAAPAGSTLRFGVTMIDEKLWKKIKIWLDYGELRGLGQWRNSGMGRFVWQEVKS